MTVCTPQPFSEAIKTVENANLREIYTHLQGIGNLSVVKTPWKGKPSNNSLSFPFCQTDGQDRVQEVTNALQSIFALDDPHTLFEKVGQAGSGSGSELRRMATLHSSSLCALLHFWNVSEDHPVDICLNGTPVTFSNAFFEVKNRVFENPSNIDVVLTGESKTGRRVVLYLESKFSEYIMKSETGKVQPRKPREKGFVSKRYFDLEWLGMESILKQLCLQACEAADKNFYFAWEDAKCEHPHWLYAEGIKQMIAHYIGVCNEIECDFNGHVPKLAEIETNKKTDFYLGIVLFDFCDAFSDKRNGFAILYRKLADELNKLQKTDRLHVVNEILTYSQLQSQLHLSEKTRQFYYGDRNGRR